MKSGARRTFDAGAKWGMKVRTSITLDRDLVAAIDGRVEQYGSRSEFLEVAARQLLVRQAREEQDRRDLNLINRRASALNREAEDVLDYQVAQKLHLLNKALGVAVGVDE
jgi:metal-responsive CopG/Arc/MetJ family transcriptional regulator